LFVFQDNCRAGAQLKFTAAVTFRSRLEPGSERRAVQNGLETPHEKNLFASVLLVGDETRRHIASVKAEDFVD
jgi:hypothetical protein